MATLHVVKQIAGHFNSQLINAVSEGKTFRLVGDNLNFTVGVFEEKSDSHKHMVHMFASAALVVEKRFLQYPSTHEIPLNELTIKDIVLSKEEYFEIQQSVKEIILQIAKEHIPQILPYIKKSTEQSINLEEDITHDFKTEVIPLPVLPYNEQHYSDVVKILDSYQDILNKVNVTSKVQIGGDQLTRERFSGAKSLRLGNQESRNFNQLQPVTFEFFHLGMNFLEKVLIPVLYKDSANIELGTLKTTVDRLIKNDFNKDVMKAYEADKSVMESFTKGYVVEALLEYFLMKDKSDTPNIMNETRDIEDFIDKYVFPMWSGQVVDESECTERENEDMSFNITLEDGTEINLITSMPTETIKSLAEDHVKNYGHCVLENGLIFMLFLDLMKSPRRSKLLAIFKMMMVVLWGKNTRAKYPLEILRLLIQQYSLLTKKEAYVTLHSCFVNTRGKNNTHVPVDLQMEWIVKEQKKHIKHMFSNKTDANIYNRSASLPGISRIAENFDQTASVVLRAKRHTKKQNFDDEAKIIEDLRKVRPFHYTEGRCFEDFPNMKKSLLEKVDWAKFGSWFQRHKQNFEP